MDMKEFEYRIYMIRKQLGILAVLLLFVGIVWYFTKPGGVMQPVADDTTKTLAAQIREGTAPMPVFSSSTQMKLEKSDGFQHLVSYTDGGFEPAHLTMKRGEVVRFTNNSSNDLWIAADGSNVEIYPRTMATCGSSDLDSCEPFTPQDFWEFSFEAAGEWRVVNNLNKERGATITVE
jgi:plastocyanin